MIDVSIDDSRIMLRLDKMSENIHANIIAETISLQLAIRNYIITNLLSGQLLNHQTGKLWSSIFTPPVEDSGTSVVGSVLQQGSIAPYGARLNDGGPGYDIFPKTAKALKFTIGGQEIFAKVVHMPAFEGRQYMQTGLRDNVQAIVDGMTAAVLKGAQ